MKEATSALQCDLHSRISDLESSLQVAREDLDGAKASSDGDCRYVIRTEEKHRALSVARTRYSFIVRAPNPLISPSSPLLCTAISPPSLPTYLPSFSLFLLFYLQPFALSNLPLFSSPCRRVSDLESASEVLRATLQDRLVDSREELEILKEEYAAVSGLHFCYAIVFLYCTTLQQRVHHLINTQYTMYPSAFTLLTILSLSYRRRGL
jgi:hypothetical protein